MTRKNWTSEGKAPEVNRFEIRKGNWATGPYGAEMILSAHNNRISVIVEMARIKALAEKHDREDRERDIRPLCGGRVETLWRYTVSERVEHVEYEQLQDTFPVQVIREHKWVTERREFGDLFHQWHPQTIKLAPPAEN